LILLYIALGVLAGIGGTFFSYAEWYDEEDKLKERNHVWGQIEENFSASEQLEIKKIWGIL